MSVPRPSKQAKDFSAIDAHDDTIESILVIPASTRKPSCTTEIVLFRHWEKTRRLLRFIDCGNVNFTLDTDVLFDNAPINTACLGASADVSEITSAMCRAETVWNVSYEEAPKTNPLTRKITKAKRYTLFRVQLFGGVLEIVAKSYQVKKIKIK